MSGDGRVVTGRSRASTRVSMSTGHIDDYYNDTNEKNEHDINQTLSKAFDRTISTVDTDESKGDQLFKPLSPIFSPSFTEFSSSVFNTHAHQNTMHMNMSNNNIHAISTGNTVMNDSVGELHGIKETKAKNKYMKIVVVGDTQVGKTTLLWTYTRGKYPDFTKDTVPKIFENYNVKVQMRVTNESGKFDFKRIRPKLLSSLSSASSLSVSSAQAIEEIELVLWDTDSEHNNMPGDNRARVVGYSDVDLVFVCYSLNNQESYENVKKVWLTEVQHFCSNVPIFLVGLQKSVTKYEGNTDQEHMDQVINTDLTKNENNQFRNVVKHIKCSSADMYNVSELFNLAIQNILIRNQDTPVNKNTVVTKNNHKAKSCVVM